MRIDGNIYNYLSSQFSPKKRNNTHKSSELKELYNSMARYNKSSPLFLLSLSESKQEHIINIKEAAVTLRDVTDNFSDTKSSLYSKRMLRSDNEAAITGAFRTQNYDSLPDELNIRLNSLATEQVNIGNYINSGKSDLAPGDYSFTLNTAESDSRFVVPVSAEDTNLDIQKKVVQYINNRDLSVTASVITEGSDSAIMLSSIGTGVPDTADGLHFSVKSESDGRALVDMLGLNQVSSSPANSEFYINEELHTSSSNHISINQIIELDFHAPSKEPVKISFTPDTDMVMNQVNMFVDAYNSLVDLSDAEKSTNVGSRNLFRDISSIVDKHKDELEAAGLLIDESNHITKNESLLVNSVSSGSFADLFNDISSFKDDINGATKRLTLDPMAYINKLLVTYPNTRNKFGASYTQSLYSGLMYNNYA